MSDCLRQQIHLTSFYGRIIAPCGLCRIGDIFHIFYECLPTDGKVQWGHFSTRDFCEFREHRPFILPDTKFDLEGAYGGCALIEKGNPVFFYAGNTALGGAKNILSATPDEDGGIAKALLLQKEDYPHDIARVSFPYTYKTDSSYKILVGAKTTDGEGCALIYTSPDCVRWEYSHKIVSHTPLGYMWDYPCTFKIGAASFLLLCPKGAVSFPESSPHTAAWAQIGENLIKDCHSLDYGFDFYAPQIFTNTDNEILMMGTMLLPDSPYDSLSSCLTIPRRLSLVEGMLYQEPLPALKELRTEKRTLSLCGGESGDTFGTVFEMVLTFSEENFALSLREDVRIECNEGNFTVTMGKSGLGRTKKSFYADDFKKIHIFSDRGSLEIFVGGKSFTTRLCDNQKGTVNILLGSCRAEIYKLNSIKFQ